MNQATEWSKTRRKWRKTHPADHEGYWYCVVGGKALTRDELTVDHNIPRGRAPDKRHELDNLGPMCWFHNSDKGSRSLEQYLASKPDTRCK